MRQVRGDRATPAGDLTRYTLVPAEKCHRECALPPLSLLSYARVYFHCFLLRVLMQTDNGTTTKNEYRIICRSVPKKTVRGGGAETGSREPVRPLDGSRYAAEELDPPPASAYS